MMTSAARRLVTAATAAMPPSRPDWGRAIAAEIDHADSRASQVRLVLAARRVALLPGSGLAVHTAYRSSAPYVRTLASVKAVAKETVY